MKILFDPIYTGKVHKCASAVKFKKLFESLSKENSELFFYWIVPSWIDFDGENWLPASDRIKYVKVEQERDRYKEYRRVSLEIEECYSYQGDLWDWDVAVTNRSGTVPTLTTVSNFHNNNSNNLKPILIVEDFPQMMFKGSSNAGSNIERDMYTVLGYQTAYETYICAYWEKKLILESAKAFLSPSELIRVRNKITECHPFELGGSVNLKNKVFVSEQNSKPFTIVFAGRMVNGHHFDKIFSIMENNWALKSRERKINSVVCTQSATEGLVEVPMFVQVNHFKREQFHDFMINEASVGLFFSEEEDYSMSLIEPLLLGVPYAVYKAPWSVASLGEDYPFFFKSEQEAYTITKYFYDDYPTNYLRFAKWQQSSFKNLLLKRDLVTIQILVSDVLNKVGKKNGGNKNSKR